MTTTNKPSDQAPTNDAWDDLETIPTPPGKDHYQAQYLYKGGAAAYRVGVFTPFMNPIVHAIAFIFLLVFVGMLWNNHHEKNLRQEAQAQKAMADMAAFQKTRASIGLERACIATKPAQMPLQYREYCAAVVKANTGKGQ